MKHVSFFFACPLLSVLAGAACDDGPVAETESSTNAATAFRCDVRSYGAKGDGVTKDTAAIQAAIDACADRGGEVHLQHGTFLSGMLRLKSAMSFVVDTDATLRGTQDDDDYPDLHPPSDNSQLKNCRKALVYAEGVHDLRLTGGGVIDGNGTAPKWNNPPEATRPMAVFVALSKNVTVDALTIKNSAMWTLVTMETDDVVIRDVTIDSTVGATRDGIDIVDDHHVRVEGCTIKSEDDSICLKSGTARGVDDVMIRNNHILQSGVANAMKLGTASYGGFSNVTFDTIDARHADKAAMAVESVDGARIENIVFRHITFHDVGTPFFVLVGDRGARPEGGPRRIGSVDGVRFEDVTGDDPRHTWGSIVSGLVKDGRTYPVRNVTFQDVHVEERGGLSGIPAEPPEYAGQYPDPNLWGDVPAYGIFLRHVDGVTFTRTAIDLRGADRRPELHTLDVSSLALPACDLTLVLHTDVDRPAFDPMTDELRIAGRVTDPIGSNVADPLGGWQGAGLTLTRDASDASGRWRFVGHALFPQGAAVELKATLRDGAGVHYELQGKGNRHIIVPNADTATIELDWEN